MTFPQSQKQKTETKGALLKLIPTISSFSQNDPFVYPSEMASTLSILYKLILSYWESASISVSSIIIYTFTSELLVQYQKNLLSDWTVPYLSKTLDQDLAPAVSQKVTGNALQFQGVAAVRKRPIASKLDIGILSGAVSGSSYIFYANQALMVRWDKNLVHE